MDEGVLFVAIQWQHTGQDVGGAVGAVVINDDDIEGEGCLLRKGALYGVLDSAHTVVDGNDDRGLHGERLLVEINVGVVRGVDKGIDGLQMLCSHLLALYLHLTIGRVDIVELFFSRLTQVLLHLRIQEFIQMQHFAVTAQPQAQVIEPAIRV